jgi:hypothetical protein
MDVDGAAVDAGDDELTAHVIPAALFAEEDAETPAAAAAAAAAAGMHNMDADLLEEQQQQHFGGSRQMPAGSSISHGSVIPAGGGAARAAHSASSNPLALMTEQRRRQQQFLQAIPAAARPAGSNLTAALAQAGGRGVPVPAGSSLAKVMQQVLAAQKEQQEQLAEAVAAASRPGSAAPQHGESMVCILLCTVEATCGCVPEVFRLGCIAWAA